MPSGLTLRGGLVPALLMITLSGCVIAPPLPPQQPMLVAYPGPGKVGAAFQQDDAVCQAGSSGIAAPQTAAGAPPGEVPRLAAGGVQGGPVGAGVDPGAQAAPLLPPGQAYLRCMSLRGNVIQPVQPEVQVAYGWYPSYPVYSTTSGYYPWLYDGYVGFGFGYGFGGYGYRGFGGYRGGYYGGYRGGEFRQGGFREGGFREGGFREGGSRGGFGGGGYGGGGFGGGGFRGGGGGFGGHR